METPKGSWFQLHTERVLLQLARIPDPSLRGDLLLIGMHALSEGGLTRDPDDLAYAVGLSVERISQLLPHLERFQDKGEDWGNEFMPGFAAEMVREQREYREQKANAGRRSAERRKQSPTLPENDDRQETKVNDAQSNPTPPNVAEQRSTSPNDVQPNKQTDKHTNKREREANEVKLTDQIANSLSDLLNVQDSAGWKLKGDVQSVAMQLAGVGATVAEVRRFWESRRKKPPLDHRWVSDFVSWRASEPLQAESPPKPHHNCLKCKDTFLVTIKGKPAKCDCWQKQEVAA